MTALSKAITKEEIEYMMAEEDLTQTEVAKRLDVTPAYINQILGNGHPRKTLPSFGELYIESQAGLTYSDIAKKYGVSPSRISVLFRKHGIHVGRGSRQSKLPSIDELQSKIDMGMTHEMIAKQYGVSASAVSQALRHARDGAPKEAAVCDPPVNDPKSIETSALSPERMDIPLLEEESIVVWHGADLTYTYSTITRKLVISECEVAPDRLLRISKELDEISKRISLLK